jgi:thiamine transporter ThiT
MTTATRVVVQAVLGAMLGVAVVFIVCVTTGAVALASGGTAQLPGLFSAHAGEENEAVALSFVPNATGMLVVVVLCSLALAVQAARRRPHLPA